MTTVSRHIIGYDPVDERPVSDYAISPERWKQISHLIRRNKNDPDCYYNYPIDVSMANDIVGPSGPKVVQNLNYFLECDAAE